MLNSIFILEDVTIETSGIKCNVILFERISFLLAFPQEDTTLGLNIVAYK